MAEVAPVTESRTCAQWAIRHPLQIAAIIGIGLFIAWLSGQWWQSTASAPAVFDSFHWTGRWLVVEYTTPQHNPCIRFGNHTMFLAHDGVDPADELRDPLNYHPLSASLNGEGLTGQGGGTHFYLWFYVDDGLPAGRWYYSYRVYNECGVGGLFRKPVLSIPLLVMTIPK